LNYLIIIHYTKYSLSANHQHYMLTKTNLKQQKYYLNFCFYYVMLDYLIMM